MNKSTVKALKGSIRKWWGIAYEGEMSHGIEDCPLCEKFYDTNLYFYGKSACDKCPVFERTGKHGCEGTPNEKFEYESEDSSAHNALTKRYAIKELEFLVSLLPPGETWESPDGWIYYNE